MILRILLFQIWLYCFIKKIENRSVSKVHLYCLFIKFTNPQDLTKMAATSAPSSTPAPAPAPAPEPVSASPSAGAAEAIALLNSWTADFSAMNLATNTAAARIANRQPILDLLVRISRFLVFLNNIRSGYFSRVIKQTIYLLNYQGTNVDKAWTRMFLNAEISRADDLEEPARSFVIQVLQSLDIFASKLSTSESTIHKNSGCYLAVWYAQVASDSALTFYKMLPASSVVIEHTKKIIAAVSSTTSSLRSWWNHKQNSESDSDADATAQDHDDGEDLVINRINTLIQELPPPQMDDDHDHLQIVELGELNGDDLDHELSRLLTEQGIPHN